MPEPNWVNRTLWTGDNLEVMRGMNDDCVDLIYLDPPFNSNRDYEAPIGGMAEGAGFKDRWTLSDAKEIWHGEIAEKHPALYEVIHAAGIAHGKRMKGYLIWMAVRLIEMRRILKPTGSIFLHCDDTAGAYLKTTMDAIFGWANCVNEIQWRRTRGRSDAKKFGRVHDTILYYRMGDEFTWEPQYMAHDPDYVKRAYRNEDERGHWQAADLTASGLRTGESGEPWRGIDPDEIGRHWATPSMGGMNDWIIQNDIIPGWPDAYPSVHARLDALDAAGLVHWPERGGMPRLKRYLDSAKGNVCDDMIVDIGKVEANSRENVNYPTQKPIRLLKRLIAAASRPGDVVLDPFCGCATACVAAEQLERQWAGIDLSELAARLVRSRLDREVSRNGSEKAKQGSTWRGLIIHREDIPRRTDLGDIPRYNDPDNKRFLFGKQEGLCNGCIILFPFRNMTIDHIIPKSRGGTDHIANLQLLCGACNSKKGTRTQEEFMALLRIEGIRQ